MKYLTLLQLLPIPIIALFFVAEEELPKHSRCMCVSLLISLAIFMTFILMIYLKVNKIVAIATALILWLIKCIYSIYSH